MQGPMSLLGTYVIKVLGYIRPHLCKDNLKLNARSYCCIVLQVQRGIAYAGLYTELVKDTCGALMRSGDVGLIPLEV